MRHLIRKANFEDLDGILKLLEQLSQQEGLVPRGKLEEVFDSILKNDDYYLNVCGTDNKLSGTSMLFIQHNLSHCGRSIGHIENVVVDEDYRGQGISKLLEMDLLMVAKQRGCYKTVLNCKEKNVPVYASVGFNRTGEIEMRVDF